MATHVLERSETFSVWKFTVGGVLAGIIAGIVNNLYIIVFPMITSYKAIPGIDSMSVTIFSFLPVLLASLVYFGIYSLNPSSGTRNYIILGIAGFLLSLYGPLFPESIAKLINTLGLEYAFTPTEGFAYFLIPLHVITALLALGFVPKFVHNRDSN